jgi:hypothetical protein
MSFTGDLEHLSIVDVVQLLHSTRKSGTLTVTGDKGECQLTFDDGFIISANHFDNSLRIGRILVEAKVLSEEALHQTLDEQRAAGPGHRPLVAALIESGRVKKEDAYRGLETLLELTIVEVLTWTTGSFTLDVGTIEAADDYRYFPEHLHQGIQFHTENVLMDALRLFDEKKRDGKLDELELSDEAFAEAFGGAEELPPPPAAVEEGVVPAEEALVLSPDDLGLEDLDRLERRIPDVFRPLEDRAAASPHRRALATLAPQLDDAQQLRLAAVLDALVPRPRADDGPALSVIVHGADELLTHCLAAACRHEGLFLFATTEQADLDPVIEQCLAKGGVPVLVLDAPAADAPAGAAADLAALRRSLKEQHPRLCEVQLAAPGDAAPAGTADDGVVAVLARPGRGVSAAHFVDDLAAFVTAFPALVRAHAREQGAWVTARVRDHLAAVRELRDASAVALALLATLGERCERALTLIVRGGELHAGRGIGFAARPGREALPLVGPALKLPLAGFATLAAAVDGGRARWMRADDPALAPLFAHVDAPAHPTALLVPLRAAGTTVSLVYADFGAREPAPVDLDLLDLLAAQSGLVLETILYRKRTEKPAP